MNYAISIRRRPAPFLEDLVADFIRATFEVRYGVTTETSFKLRLSRVPTSEVGALFSRLGQLGPDVLEIRQLEPAAARKPGRPQPHGD